MTTECQHNKRTPTALAGIFFFLEEKESKYLISIYTEQLLLHQIL